MLVSILIPSRVPTYLQRTIDDLLANAAGDVEVIVVLDGYAPDPPVQPHPMVRVLSQPWLGMRAAVNLAASEARGDYLMKVDEHCKFDRGYEEQLAAVCEGHCLAVPRRHRLDPAAWTLVHDHRPPVDHMFLSRQGGYLHGWRWDERTIAHQHIPVEDVMTIQGSCWFMPRRTWDELVGPLDEANYGPFANEAQEVSLKVWLNGGRCVVNKNTWYAHYHKKERGGGYGFTPEQYQAHKASIEKGRRYCWDHWTNHFRFQWLLEKFKPVPTWHQGFSG